MIINSRILIVILMKHIARLYMYLVLLLNIFSAMNGGGAAPPDCRCIYVCIYTHRTTIGTARTGTPTGAAN
jgi:hypothetical protein